MDILHVSVDNILKQHLGLRKISSRWVPHQFIQQKRQRRADICLENLHKFENGAWRFCHIATGDERWFYHRKIRSKQESKTWIALKERPPAEMRRQ